MDDIKKHRWMLKAKFVMLRKEEIMSDQMKGMPPPDPFKKVEENETLLPLPPFDDQVIKNNNISTCIHHRQSVREYSNEAISIEELSYLLWATQGIRKPSAKPYIYFRNVPSAGCRHSFETYIAAHQVKGLKQGIYRYDPLNHGLVLLFHDENTSKAMIDAALGQAFVGHCAVTFIWSTIPYRMEWRYSLESVKLILLDAGHVCQNLSLSAVSINADTCAIGAYDQDYIDQYLSLDPDKELVVYMASLGKSR